MLIAGKMMWAEIVNANCSRASTRTSLVWSIRLALLSQPHRSLLSRVDVQAEHIRRRVMTDDIEIVRVYVDLLDVRFAVNHLHEGLNAPPIDCSRWNSPLCAGIRRFALEIRMRILGFRPHTASH